MTSAKIPLLFAAILLLLGATSFLFPSLPTQSLTRILGLTRDAPVLSLVLSGDVMLGRSVNSRLTRTRDYAWPFRYLSDVFQAADLTYINLESPLISNCPTTDTGMRFCGDSSNVQSLLFAGVDVASLANNHALDYGPAGLAETIQLLGSHQIMPSGVGSVVIKQVQGVKFAFVSFNDVNQHLPGIDSPTETNLDRLLTTASSQADFVVATFHWGREYEAEPTARQITLAHQAVSLGADLVVGAHPHWIQTKETYLGVPIYYSLGNTIFDQEWSEATKTGLVLKVYIQDSHINRIDELVLYSSNYGQPRWITQSGKE